MRTVKRFREIGEEFFTVSEVAKLLRANPKTVYRWIELGSLRAVKVEEGYGNQIKPHIVIPRSSLREFIENHLTIGELKVLVNHKELISRLFRSENIEEVKKTAEFIYNQLLNS